MAHETPDQGRAGGSETAKSESSLTDAADDLTRLVRRADRVLRAALREGVTGPEVEQLLDWCARHRVRQRQAKARRGVTDVLADIRRCAG